MYPKTLFLSILFFTTSCGYIEYVGQWPPSEGNSASSGQPDERILLEPNKEVYNLDETIKGVYRNNSFDTLYVFFPHGGGDSPLQKWNGSNWEKVNTRKKGTYYTQSVRYIPLAPGKTRTLQFPGERLKEMDFDIEGMYRFLFTLTHKNEYGSKSERIASRPFVVE